MEQGDVDATYPHELSRVYGQELSRFERSQI